MTMIHGIGPADGIGPDGREHVESSEDGLRFTLQKIIPFEQWLDSRYSKTKAEFMKLSTKERRDVFLRWKWGFTNPESNEAIEATERQILDSIKDFDQTKLSEGYRFHFEHKQKYDEYCTRVKTSIGLLDSVITPEVRRIMEKFDGTQTTDPQSA